MRVNTLFGVMGMLLCTVGASMLLPVIFALYYGEESTAISLLVCFLVTLCSGLVLRLLAGGKMPEDLSKRESMVIVGFGWFLVCVFGALPYVVSGSLHSFSDAVFESISGFTTTGATIMPNVESMPRGILMWRALTHWLGGMGIIVMFLAMLPFLGIGGMQLYRAEMPDLFGDNKYTPRVKDTATGMCVAYFIFTGVLLLLLYFGGMTFFDSICHTFSIIASGGFANYNNSMAHYPSAFLQWVMIIFMFITGMNYAIHYKLLRGNFKTLLRDEEFRLYLIIVLIATVIISLYIFKSGVGAEGTVRASAMQVVSIISTTGVTTEDYSKWPAIGQSILLLLMFIGACGGSTAGGLKCMRVVVLLKCAYHELFKVVHPRAVRHLKLGGTVIAPEVVGSVCNFLVIYLLVFLLSSLVLTALGLDVLTAFSSVLSCLGCVGPAFGLSGPAFTYADFPMISKWILSLDMLIGRLECYAVLVLFMPIFWRR